MTVVVKKRNVPLFVETNDQGDPMTMPPGYTPPPPAAPPGIDPTTGLPFTQQQQQPAGTQLPNGDTINITVPPAPPVSETLTRAEVEAILNAERERVRKEEKDKLYPQIEEQKQQLATLTQEREERLAAEQAAQQAAAEAQRLAAEAEMDSRQLLEQYKSEQEQRFNELVADRDRERVLREKEQEFGRLQEYRGRRMAEEASAIAPQLVDFVSGNNEEQIEQSIARVKEKTAQILAEVQQAQLGQRRQLAPPIAGVPPVDMQGGGDGERTLSIDELRSMDMSDYAANRQQLLGAASARARENGPYAP